MHPLNIVFRGPGAENQPKKRQGNVHSDVQRLAGQKTPWALFEPQPGKRQFGQTIESQNQRKPANVFGVFAVMKEICQYLRAGH